MFLPLKYEITFSQFFFFLTLNKPKFNLELMRNSFINSSTSVMKNKGRNTFEQVISRIPSMAK